MNESHLLQELRHYLGAVHKRRWLGAACVTLSLLGATVYNSTTRPVYRATAQVLIDRYVFQAGSLRERAQAQAAAADHSKALVILAEGTESLQRALKAAGMIVPQSMGTQ